MQVPYIGHIPAIVQIPTFVQVLDLLKVSYTGSAIAMLVWVQVMLKQVNMHTSIVQGQAILCAPEIV